MEFIEIKGMGRKERRERETEKLPPQRELWQKRREKGDREERRCRKSPACPFRGTVGKRDRK